jgi:O-antigen/teichoic acid export membrane protein
MKSVAKRYKSFPIFNFPASVVNTISTQLPPLMLLALYDSQTVGFYALAQMLIVLPGSVISGSMGQAYLGEASKMVREGSQQLRSLYGHCRKIQLFFNFVNGSMEFNC